MEIPKEEVHTFTELQQAKLEASANRVRMVQAQLIASQTQVQFLSMQLPQLERDHQALYQSFLPPPEAAPVGNAELVTDVKVANDAAGVDVRAEPEPAVQASPISRLSHAARRARPELPPSAA